MLKHMTKLTSLLAICTLMSACTSVTSPNNEMRVTEYGGQYGIVNGGAIGGCRVIQNGTIDACVRYAGERCAVESNCE